MKLRMPSGGVNEEAQPSAIEMHYSQRYHPASRCGQSVSYAIRVRSGDPNVEMSPAHKFKAAAHPMKQVISKTCAIADSLATRAVGSEPRFPIRGWASAIAVVGCIAWLLSAVLFLQRRVEVNALRDSLDHSQSVLTELENVQLLLRSAESGQRGYMITHQSQYLAPYTRASGQIRQSMQNLQRLLGDPSREQTLARLQPLIADKMAELKRAVDLQRRGESAAAVGVILSGRGHRDMVAIEDTLSRLRQQERVLTISRTDALRRAMNLVHAMLLSMMSLSAVVVGLFLYLLNRYLRESRQWLWRKERAEAAEQERRTRASFDAMPQLAWTARPDGSVYFFNRSWYEYTGTTYADVQGWGWQKVHDPELVPEVLERWRHSLATLTPFEMAMPLRRADGAFRWFLTHAAPILDQSQNVVRWIGIHTDVDDQTAELKNVNTRLKTSEDRLNLALEAAEVGVYELELATGKIWRSLRLDQILGYRELQPEATYEKFLSHVVEEDRKQVDDVVKNGWVTGSFDFECRIARDGATRWIEVQGKVTSDAQGNPEFVRGTVRDISERKEHLLAQEYLAAIADSSADAIITKDVKGIVTSWNKGAERIFGYTAAEMVGRHISALVPPDYPNDVPAILARVLHGKNVVGHETTRMRKDGVKIAVSITVSPIKDENGKVIRACEIARDISARKRHEEALYRDKNVLQSVFKNAPDAIFVADDQGIVQSVNLQAEKMFGYNARELNGKPLESLMLQERQVFGDEHTLGPATTDANAYARRKDDSLFPVDITLRSVKTEAGRVVMAVVRDLTEEKRLEAERRKIEDSLKAQDALLKASKPDPVLIKRAQAGSRLCAAAVSILGLLVIIGCAFHILILRNPTPWGCYIPLNAAICFLLSGLALYASSVSKDYAFAKYLCWAASFIVALIAGITLCEWIFPSNFAIDQLLLPDTALRYATIPGRMPTSAAAAFLILALGSVALGVRRISLAQVCGFLCFLVGIVSLIGHTFGFITLLSFGSTTLIAFPASIALILAGAALFLVHAEQGVARIVVSSSLGGRLFRRLWPLILLTPVMGVVSGMGRSTTFDLLLLAVVIAVFFPLAVWLVASTIDRLDRQKDQALDRASERREALEVSNRQLADAVERALQASKLKSAFVANISHELRTPLSGIIGNTELLLGAPVTVEQQRQSLETTLECSQSLLQIVNDLLDLSKIESGKFSLEESPFHLLDPVDNVVKVLGDAARQKGLLLKVERDSELPVSVIGDHGRLQQVLLNLANNAIKFTAAGEIRLRVTALKGSNGDANISRVRFEVSDTGIGIAEEDQSLLFKPFSQVDSSVTRKFGGVGLGLSLCKKFVELMGGTIGIQSALGEGSTFWFILPFRRAEGTEFSPSGAHPVDTMKTFHDKRVLLVEDNMVVQKVITKQLLALGLQVESASNGKEALNMVPTSRFDAILMDCNLPDLSGLDVTKQIRSMEERLGYHTPIVAMTAAAMKGDRERCLAAGMDDYLSKPVAMNQLSQTLQHWIGPGSTSAVA